LKQHEAPEFIDEFQGLRGFWCLEKGVGADMGTIWGWS
jgi:hypothetical protein